MREALECIGGAIYFAFFWLSKKSKQSRRVTNCSLCGNQLRANCPWHHTEQRGGLGTVALAVIVITMLTLAIWTVATEHEHPAQRAGTPEH